MRAANNVTLDGSMTDDALPDDRGLRATRVFPKG